MKRRTLFAVAGVVAIVGWVAVAARAEPGVSRLSARVDVGVAVGPHPHVAVDLARSRRAPDALPERKPRLVWRATGPDGGRVLVSKSGVFVAGSEIAAFDADGRERWSVPVEATPLGAPALAANGTVAVVRTDGIVVGVRDGARVFRRALAAQAREESRGTGVLPLADGGFLVHWGDSIHWLDGDGNPRDSLRASVAARFVAPLVVTGGAVYGATLGGAVYRVRGHGDPEWVGAFGGNVDEFAAFGKDAFVAVVGGDRLVVLSRAGAASVVGRAEALERFAGVVATTGARVCTVARRAQQLAVVCFERETTVLRTLVETLPLVATDAGPAASAEQAVGGPSLLLDDAGRVAYVSNREMQWLSAAGATAPMATGFCHGPSADLAAGGPGTIFVRCGREIRKYMGESSP